MGQSTTSTNPEQFVSLSATAIDWIVLFGFAGILLGIDMWLNRNHEVHSRRRIVIETLCWIATAFVFLGYVIARFGAGAGGEYLSGYLIEKSLSVDNVFVWAVVLSQFSIPLRYQHKVLFWGIFGAVALRAVFIFAGAALLQAIWWSVLIFGILLCYTGIKVLRHSETEDAEHDSFAVKLVGRFMPVSEELDGHRFLSSRNGTRVATPLLAALVVVEFTDVVFAVDSVPAILAVSRSTFIVFSSNVFAILGLRSLYFLLADAKEKLHYLSHALGAILVFVGAKMALSHWWHMQTAVSLAVVVVILACATVASIARSARVARGR